jgi:hydroxymethylpyrimidine pyrophosphatase-like HAD family hydrolase
VIIDKGKGLLEVMRVLKTMNDEIVAIGISNNDLPLFRDVGQSIIVGNKPVAYHRAKRFSDIGEALDYLKSLFNVSNG